MANEFGRRLKDLVDGIRAEALQKSVARADDPSAARARRRHLEKAAAKEADDLLRAAEPVLAGLGLRPKSTPEEIRVEAVPGARMPERFPPWLRVSFHPPAFDTVRVAVVEVSWRVDDPRTPLPEAPCTLRHVLSDDAPADLGDLRDFLSVALEDFAACVARNDVIPRA
ncbi:MAG: hypothetical protein L6R43_11510 [Planctomycetes bacterium]|nr:hypothetical protein [Planctomycetota bacterium]